MADKKPFGFKLIIMIYGRHSGKKNKLSLWFAQNTIMVLTQLRDDENKPALTVLISAYAVSCWDKKKINNIKVNDTQNYEK